ncbi:hypothetical protein D5086_027221 [Populus alba]
MAGAFALWIGWLGVYLGVHGEGRVMHAFLRVASKVGPATFPVGAPGPCCCTRLGGCMAHAEGLHVLLDIHFTSLCAAVRSLDGRLDAGT